MSFPILLKIHKTDIKLGEKLIRGPNVWIKLTNLPDSKVKDFWIISLVYAKSLFKNILDIKFLFANRSSKFLQHILGLMECLIMIRYLYEGDSQIVICEKAPSKRPRI